MDSSPGIKFGDLQKEERYKRLEQNLKLSLGKRIRASNDKGYSTSPTWPSLSSINPDGMDTSCANGPTASPLQVSRVESEVVASSNNLRKMLPTHKSSGGGQRMPTATSSVKKFPVHDLDRDRAIMPPPPAIMAPQNVKRSSSQGNLKAHVQEERREQDSSEVHESLGRATSGACSDHQEPGKADGQAVKSCRVFSRWRVLLNDQRQLIIKGTLEGGKIARSKPVIRRITSTKVQSIYKHIYVLDGTVVDDRMELPDYVRGKFHNGFPDDWENVHQLWKSYKADGCQVTFRWPTRITDSDDDLMSEITEFAYVKNSNKSNEYNNCSSSGYHSKIQTDSQQVTEKSNEEHPENDSPKTEAAVNKKSDECLHSSEPKDASTCGTENSTKDNSVAANVSSSQSGSNLKNTNYLSEIIQEDKLRIILSNLGDKNCPPQYLDKFVEVIDFLRDILSFTPSNNHETEDKVQQQQRPPSPSRSQTTACQKCNMMASFSETLETNPEEQSKEPPGKPEENCQQTKPDNDVTNDSSDSDAYMGIPNVSLNHLIRSKTPRLQRYRQRRSRGKDKLIQPPEDDAYNSGVSMTEDQEKCTEVGRNPKSIKEDNIIGKVDHECVHAKRSRSSLPLPPEIAVKPKPVIKSYKAVNIDLKTMRAPKIKVTPSSDVSISRDEGSKRPPRVNNDINKNVNNSLGPLDIDTEETPDVELLQNRFLTYDSEDFITEEEETNAQVQVQTNHSNGKAEKRNAETAEKTSVQNKRSQNPEKRAKVETDHKMPSSPERKQSSKASKSELFGSKENPKILMAWVPCVVYNDESKKKCSLTFEGKLLNEAGHVLHRKFVTEAIQQRHSSRLVQTVGNEYFRLVGELNDTKHVLPKELLKQCRTGCPGKIKEFCEEWKKLEPGEKVVTKDFEPVYNPGNVPGTLAMKTDSSKKPTISSDQRPQKSTSKREADARISRSSGKPSNTNDPPPFDLEQRQRPERKRVAQKLQYSSTSDSDEKGPLNKKTIRNRPSSPTTQPPNENARVNYHRKNAASRTDEALLAESTHNLEALLAESAYSLRKRQRVDTKDDFKENTQLNAPSHARTRQVPQRKCTTEIKWKYEKEQEYHDVLSEDQASVVVRKD